MFHCSKSRHSELQWHQCLTLGRAIFWVPMGTSMEGLPKTPPPSRLPWTKVWYLPRKLSRTTSGHWLHWRVSKMWLAAFEGLAWPDHHWVGQMVQNRSQSLHWQVFGNPRNLLDLCSYLWQILKTVKIQYKWSRANLLKLEKCASSRNYICSIYYVLCWKTHKSVT